MQAGERLRSSSLGASRDLLCDTVYLNADSQARREVGQLEARGGGAAPILEIL